MIFLQLPKLYNFILLIALSSVFCIKQKAKTVTTLIDAKWEVTPLVLEVAEYIADESKDDFWGYVNSISKLNPQLIDLENDKIQYDTALHVCLKFENIQSVYIKNIIMTVKFLISLQLAESYLSELQLKALKLALSLHIFSPKIEMFGQIASEHGLPESRCPSAIHFDGKLFCNKEEFVQYLKKKG